MLASYSNLQFMRYNISLLQHMHASVMMVISQSIISIRDYAMKFSLQRKRVKKLKLFRGVRNIVEKD